MVKNEHPLEKLYSLLGTSLLDRVHIAVTEDKYKKTYKATLMLNASCSVIKQKCLPDSLIEEQLKAQLLDVLYGRIVGPLNEIEFLLGESRLNAKGIAEAEKYIDEIRQVISGVGIKS